MKSAFLVLAAWLFLSVTAFARDKTGTDKNFYAFLSFGQSNMEAPGGALLAGELLGAYQNGACGSMTAIIDDPPKTIPNSSVVSSVGCPGRPNYLHFTPAGYRMLGMRYREKMLSVMGYKIVSPH